MLNLNIFCVNECLTQDALLPLDCYVLFVQPYNECYYNAAQILNEKQSFRFKFKHVVAALFLLIPVINHIAFLILRVCKISQREGELHFKWEDINKLVHCNLGLRHVSSREIWEKESNEGFLDGCSLSLMPHKSLFARKKSWNQIYLHDRSELLKSVEEGIDDFIVNSLVYDMRFQQNLMELNKTRIKDVVSIIDFCYFSIIKYNKETSPCDLNSWGKGLGRHSKSAIQPHQIISLEPIKVRDLGYSEKNLQEVIISKDHGNDIFKRMVSCYRGMLLKAIREMPEL